MVYKVLNRVALQNEHRPSQIKETTLTIQEQSPFTQFTRTLDGDWRNETDNTTIDAVLKQVYKDTFSGRYESERVIHLENQVLKSNEIHRDTGEKVIQLEKDLTKQIDEVNKLVDTIIHAEDLTEAQRELVLARYPEYRIGQYYVGKNESEEDYDIINYNDELYEVVQSHVAQGDWIPSETPALYTPVNNVEVEDEEGNEVELIKDFVQPTGGHDAYQTDDKIRFDGEIYESTIDNNVYSPDDYAQGWKLVEEKE